MRAPALRMGLVGMLKREEIFGGVNSKAVNDGFGMHPEKRLVEHHAESWQHRALGPAVCVRCGVQCGDDTSTSATT